MKPEMLADRLRDELAEARMAISALTVSNAELLRQRDELRTAAYQARFCLTERLPLDSDALLTVKLLTRAIEWAK